MMQKPNFYLTYYNPYEKGNPNLIQSYINYKRDVNNLEYNANIISNSIREANKEQIKALENGFRKMDERLTQIFYAQQSTNLLLFDIIELLKLPDSEKQRQLHIINGIKFTSKSAKNESIISDAILEFESAVELKKQDWISHYHLGLCHLHYVEHLNIEKAKIHFETALKYSLVDDDFDEKINLTIGLNQISGELFKKNQYLDEIEDVKSNEIPTSYIFDIYFNLIKIEYILGNYENGLKYIEIILSFINDFENHSTKWKFTAKSRSPLRLLLIYSYIFDIYTDITNIYYAKLLTRLQKYDLAIEKIDEIKNSIYLFIVKQDKDISKLRIDNKIENKINEILEEEEFELTSKIEYPKLELLIELHKFYIYQIIGKINNNNIRNYISDKNREFGSGYTYGVYIGKIKRNNKEDTEIIKKLYEKYRNDEDFLKYFEELNKYKKNKKIWSYSEAIEEYKYFIPYSLNSKIFLKDFLNNTNFDDWNKRESKMLKRLIKHEIDENNGYSDFAIHLKKYSILYIILLIPIDIILIIKNENLFKVFNLTFVIVLIVKLLADKANGKKIN